MILYRKLQIILNFLVIVKKILFIFVVGTSYICNKKEVQPFYISTSKGQEGYGTTDFKLFLAFFSANVYMQ